MRYQVVVNDSLRQNSSGLSSCLNHQPLIRSDQLWLPPPTSSGPYVIQQVHVNGTLTILHSPTVYERIKVCDVCCLLLSSLFCTVCSKNLKIKTIDVLLLNWKLYPDAFQIERFLKQLVHPASCWSKLKHKKRNNYALWNHSALRTFGFFLFGAQINIYFDHKKPSFNDVDNTDSHVLHPPLELVCQRLTSQLLLYCSWCTRY